MNKIKNILIIVFIYLLSNCGNSQNDTNRTSIKDYFNIDYKKSLDEFPDSLTKHFPKYLNEENISYSTSIKNKPKDFLYLIVKNKLTNKSKLELNNTPDTCIIKIYAERNTYGFNKKGLGECKSYIPVPDYSLFSYNENEKKPKDLKYYVLETSHHIFINHKLYLRYYLPDEWKNGMSRGIAISKKEEKIYYWLIMW